MYILITYDVCTSDEGGQKRLRKVSKCCSNYGQRVQNSVFECLLSESQFLVLKSELTKIIDKEADSIRIYRLGKNYSEKIAKIGKESSFDIEGVLLI